MLASVAGQQACSQHNTGVRGVGATCDGRNHDITVVQIINLAVSLHHSPFGEVFLCQAVTVVAQFMSERFDVMRLHA